jgi:hypothetical protein
MILGGKAKGRRAGRIQLPIDHITIRDIFTLSYEINLKEPPLSGWLVLIPSNWIASVKKTCDAEDSHKVEDCEAARQVALWRFCSMALASGESGVVSTQELSQYHE